MTKTKIPRFEEKMLQENENPCFQIASKSISCSRKPKISPKTCSRSRREREDEDEEEKVNKNRDRTERREKKT